MTSYEIIKILCKKEGISISILEKELGFGNGSLSKAKKIPAERIRKIASRFNVSMEYLMNEEPSDLLRKEDSTKEIIDNDSLEIALHISKHPEYKFLYEASKNIRDEDIPFLKDFINRMTAYYDAINKK